MIELLLCGLCLLIMNVQRNNNIIMYAQQYVRICFILTIIRVSRLIYYCSTYS